jgi:RNA recognition motif-containing protein
MSKDRRDRSDSRDRGDRGGDRGGNEEEKEDNSQIYVGRLPRGLHDRDLEDIFTNFGKIRSCLMKRGFAFIVSSQSLISILGVL